MKKNPGNLLKKPGKITEISWNLVSPKKWEPCSDNRGFWTIPWTGYQYFGCFM